MNTSYGHSNRAAFLKAFKGRRVLFITRFYLYPLHTGALQYSHNLIEAVASSAQSVTVVCAEDERHRHFDADLSPANAEFLTFKAIAPSKFMRLLSASPYSTAPFDHSRGHEAVRRALATSPDIAVIDHVGASWAASLLPDRLPLVYCTHNDEAATRLSIARESRGVGRLAHFLDAWKIWRRDRSLCKRAAMVTAICKADCEVMQRRYAMSGCTILHPCWRGSIPDLVNLDDAPRSVLLLGSLLWSAKKRNLKRFLDVNLDALSDAGVGVIVAGRAEQRFIEQLRDRYPAATFVGEVDSERMALERARIGIIYGEAGGGFRLTGLTFSMHGLPIAARPALIDDLGLTPSEDFLAVPHDDQIAETVIQAIDDPTRLSRMRAQARAKVAERFAEPKLTDECMTHV